MQSPSQVPHAAGAMVHIVDLLINAERIQSMRHHHHHPRAFFFHSLTRFFLVVLHLGVQVPRALVLVKMLNPEEMVKKKFKGTQ